MKPNSSNSERCWIVLAFAVAMAWVESAVVFYIRTHVNRIEPYQPDPLPLIGTLGPVELARELATLIMHFTVGMLAAPAWRSRFGYMAISFGVWDIFYYIFLKVMCGWPNSLWDWDILFLLPLPWWGPVLAPVSIALLMIVWGALAIRSVRPFTTLPANRTARSLCALGIGLALYVFMADAIRVSNGGVAALRTLLPTQFNWPLFCVALVLMSAPMIQLCRVSLNDQFLRMSNERSE
jgi:hypothetical protein